jgi:hypothetical protein
MQRQLQWRVAMELAKYMTAVRPYLNFEITYSNYLLRRKSDHRVDPVGKSHENCFVRGSGRLDYESGSANADG